MSDPLPSLRRYMPEWMALKGVEVLEALPGSVLQWVRDTADEVSTNPGVPARDAWRATIVERFGAGRSRKHQDKIVTGLSAAVLLVAIQKLPAPVLSSDSGITDIRSTKELDLPAVKRSRILGMLEPHLDASDEGVLVLLRAL